MMQCSLLTNLFGLAVWGGDPVYPTVNYIQDPDEVIDYRGADFHEPTPDMLSFLKEVGTFHIPLFFFLFLFIIWLTGFL